MGEVVELGESGRDDEARAASVAAALAELEEVRQRLLSAALRVACAGVWRGWDASTPIGSKVTLGVDSFAGCGDPVAEVLARLAGEVEDRHAELEAGARDGATPSRRRRPRARTRSCGRSLRLVTSDETRAAEPQRER